MDAPSHPAPTRPRRVSALPVALLLIAAVLRFAAFGQAGRFHPDEALFATFARSAALNGDWLLPGALDKPPLSIYASAVTMALLVDDEAAPGLPDIHPHTGEFAARLHNLFASLLTAALAYRLARNLYASRRVALLTLALVAFSPFAIAFAPTAFTDNWLHLFATAALAAVTAGRWGWAGSLLALAFWSKQQALFAVPLVLALGWLVDTRPRSWRRWLALGGAFVVGVGLLWLWDTARAQPDGLWALASTNNDPWRLIRSGEVWPRMRGWLDYAGWLLGTPPLSYALVALAVVAALLRAIRRARERGSALDLVLLAYIAAYLALHWLVAFNLYDRYLLPVLVPLALLAARGLNWLIGWLTPRRRGWAGGVLAALLVWGALVAAAGGVPVGGDRGKHDGIDRAATFLNGRALGAIVYDYWLGWELDYYLGQWTDKRRVYYPSTGALAADALRQPDPAPRYFIAPQAQPHHLWLTALTDAGFGLDEVYNADGFVIYALRPPWADAD